MKTKNKGLKRSELHRLKKYVETEEDINFMVRHTDTMLFKTLVVATILMFLALLFTAYIGVKLCSVLVMVLVTIM